MRKYIQITLIPEEPSGITAPVLMGYVMEKLHQLFVQIKDHSGKIPIGISFPEYDASNKSLGTLVRIHGDEEKLKYIDARKAMQSLQDYVHVSAFRGVPESRLKGHVAYARIRHDHGKDKLIRRSMRRHNLSFEAAEKAYSSYQQRHFPEYPFVLMSSKSTGHEKYPLYFKRIFLNNLGTSFNTFGINPESGVEHF